MTRILFICHGNICRSPMAEFVMKDLVKKAGLESEFHIVSAATSTEEIGNPVIRSSICTGEQVAGFKDPVSGKFQELMPIRDSSDLADFLHQYQVEEQDIQREW